MNVIGFLGGLLNRNRKPASQQDTDDAQVQAFIGEIHKYLNKRLFDPQAEILQLAFLDHSTEQNNRNATAKVQLFFQQTISQLQTYQNVLNALHPRDQMFIFGKQKTLEVLNKLIIDCRSFETNAPYYNLRVHDGTLKKFLNSTVRDHMATLELYIEKN